jgi:hypothetical protein
VCGGAGGEILSCSSPPSAHAFPISRLRRGDSSWAWWQEAERAYLLWKARQVADEQGSGAVAVKGEEEGKEGEALVDFAVKRLKGDLFPDLVEYMG